MDPSLDHHEYCTGGFHPDDIVVSGMAGRFPSCDSVKELQEGLYQKKELITYTEDRFDEGVLNMPYPSAGTISDIDKFDADFFCISHTIVNNLEPTARKHMEVAYEAIADSGCDPSALRGQRVGVFNATVSEDASQLKISSSRETSLQGIRTMIPNRLSHALDLRGPSYTMDAACSSSAIALWSAYNSLKQGHIDAAIVSGNQINMNPLLAYVYFHGMIASPTGTNSRPFDADSDGMVRTEAVAAIFLQRANTARRVYGIIKSSTFYTAGYVQEGITVPSLPMQIITMKDNLKNSGLTSEDVQYVEGHGTGTLVGDPIELNALHEAFRKSSSTPLLVGSIKSNIGHTEASAGVCGTIKALLALDNSLIPPNIHYEKPNPHAKCLLEGTVKIVTEPTPLEKPHVIVTSFGLAGTLVAITIKQNPKTYPDKKAAKSALPRIVLYPATTEEGVRYVLDYMKKNYEKLTDEFFALLNKLSFTNCFLKPFRGYSLLRDPANPVTQIKTTGSNTRPVWYVMTGMGCQWSGMGLQLMELEVFAKSIRKSAEILKPYGFDLLELVRPDKNYLQIDRNITPAFVSIAAIQIAMVDLLNFLEVSPDGMVGHSTGELICAYADGCCTHEQTILSSYWRGKSVESSNLPCGAMAAVGMSWQEAKSKCPEGIYPACDNAHDSVTLSGMKEPLEKFVAKLTGENIFARVVNAYGYAFHSPCVHPAAEKLRSALKELIPNPKPRTQRWVSSSYTESEWEMPNCKLATAEYFVHNLMSNVLFFDALKKVPADAIVIEIGPHFLLQSIMKRVVGSQGSYFGLMKRNEADNVKFFFDSLGKMYLEGVNVKVEKLYPAVQFPVPRQTASISDLIRWNHSLTFDVPRYTPNRSDLFVDIKTDKEEDAYLLDHKIDGRSLFPATGYIFLAWDALARKSTKSYEEMSVEIQNFKIHRATILSSQKATPFNISMLESTGHFEITEGKSLVASGDICECKNLVFQEELETYKCEDFSSVSGKDLYNELKMSGYEYGPAFQGLVETNLEGTGGLVLWRKRWIPYLDSLLLFFGMITKSHEFCLPTGALSFKIDPSAVKKYCAGTDEDKKEQSDVAKNFPVTFNPKTRICRSVGVEIASLNVDYAPRRPKGETPTLEEYKFLSYASCYAPQGEAKTYLSNYMSVCNEVVSKIGKALEKDVTPYRFAAEILDEFTVEEFMETICEEHMLLSTLLKVSQNPKELEAQKKDLLSEYEKGAGKDLLNTALLNEESLRIVMDIILENTYRKLSVLEVKRSSAIVLTRIIEVMQKYTAVKFKKSILVVPTKSPESNEVMEELGIQQISEEKMDTLAEEKGQDVAIGSFTCGTLAELQDLLQFLKSVVKTNGFIVLFLKEIPTIGEKFLYALCGVESKFLTPASLEKALKIQNLLVLNKISDQFGSSVYLLRAAANVQPQAVINVEESSYGWVETIKDQLYKKHKKEAGLVWLLAKDTSINGIIGMVNCLKQEPGGERIRCIFISRKGNNIEVPPFNFEHPFYHHLKEKGLVMNVYQDGLWGSFRHILFEPKQIRIVDDSYITCRKFGDLSTFEWIESQIKYNVQKHQKILHVYYAGLNFRDVMLASGKLSVGIVKDVIESDGSVLGLEFSGRDSDGKKVCGIVKSGAMATAAIIDPDLRIEVPENWTLEEAATVPVVYTTCFYALILRAKLQKGERILIHSGTGGIGIAAINIALGLDCEIFTTVGNDEKRKYLKKKFPQLKDENIGCSRNVSFKSMIMNRTNGEGVDVVLNSLADDKFKASLQCVARNGRFIEIGKYDLAMDRQIGLKMFLDNISFHGVFVDQLLQRNASSKILMKEVFEFFRDGIKRGIVKPLDRTVFGRNDIEDAFRYMGKGVHVGKVLLKIRDEEKGNIVIPKTLSLPAYPTTYFYPNKVYIIIGGLGGFGIELTKWIISRGAKNIILTSRYGERTPYHYLCLKRWKKQEANVRVSTYNVEHRSDTEKLLEEASQVGPVGGIFNSAVVLKDTFMDCQTAEDFHEVCAPKAIASKNLDELSRKMRPALDYFICFSSISCGRGNAGQTNYGFANSVMERICEDRRRDGLHGLSVQWGIIGEVGVVHRHMGDDAMIAGVMAQNVKSCLETLDSFCQHSAPVVASYVSAAAAKKSTQGDVLAQVIKILGLNDVSEVNTVRSFGEMGIDSMVGVEMKQLIESYCDISISMQEIQDMKFEDIKNLISKADTEKSSTQSTGLMATTVVKLPPTLVQSVPLIPLNKDAPGTPIFIVSIGDSEVTDFRILAETLGKPVYALVWTKDVPSTKIESLASWYLNLIESKFSGPFHLFGNSIGSCVAYEMALQSEKANKQLKTLTLLSGSDDLINSLTRADSESKDPELTALCRFVAQFGSAPRLEEELQKTPTTEQRIKTVLNFLTSSSSQSVNKNDLSESISNYLQKCSIVEAYLPSEKLSKDVNLLEDPASVLANDVTILKEHFSQICNGKINVHRVFSYKDLSNKDDIERVVNVLQTIV